MPLETVSPDRHFPVSAGILFGLGLGGFFDGIVLHQVLQWHHMLSSWYPVNTVENLELNTFWDGIFHSATYLFVVAALFVLWRTAKRTHLYWSTQLLTGSMLLGFGVFNPWKALSTITCSGCTTSTSWYRPIGGSTGTWVSLFGA
jgi:uncharacterized membrane protein